MKQCPFCYGEIPDAARKCQHCGEWVVSSAQLPTSYPDDELGRAANRYVDYQMVMSVIGLIVFLIILFFVFLPRANHGPGMPGFAP